MKYYEIYWGTGHIACVKFDGTIDKLLNKIAASEWLSGYSQSTRDKVTKDRILIPVRMHVKMGETVTEVCEMHPDEEWTTIWELTT